MSFRSVFFHGTLMGPHNDPLSCRKLLSCRSVLDEVMRALLNPDGCSTANGDDALMPLQTLSLSPPGTCPS